MHKDSIYLYGPSGSGKSTVGKILADNLNLDFIDLDDQIEYRSGKTIPEIFDLESEISFRSREKDALSAIFDKENKVVALGGGALTSPENRGMVEGDGPIIVLNASASKLKTRIENDSNIRPLLVENLNNNFEKLLHKRKSHYQSFQNHIDTSDKTPDEVAWDIQIHIGRFRIQGMASERTPGYDVLIADGLLTYLADLVTNKGFLGPIVVVTDDNVGLSYLPGLLTSLELSGYTTSGFTIPAGESFKTIDTVSNLWDYFISNHLERKSTVLALGGGVIGDLTGFAAATYLRGVPWIGVPTSLLAMVDSSIGGKTGVDLHQGKNLIGSFYPPQTVLIDPTVLKTLPEIEVNNGMAEVIKHGVIGDPVLFSLCEKIAFAKKTTLLSDVVRRALAVKVNIIEMDPYEKGIRESLNFGHTIGHGIELVSNYRLRHGEAVAIGMVAETKIGEMLGYVNKGLSEVISKTLKTQNLPVEIPSDLNKEEIIRVIRRDKKVSRGIVRFAIPQAIGSVKTGVVLDGWEEILLSIDR